MGRGLCREIWVRRRMGHECASPFRLRVDLSVWFKGNKWYRAQRVKVFGHKMVCAVGELEIPWNVPPCCFRISNRKE